MSVRRPPRPISISRYNAVPSTGELSPSGTLNPGDHVGENTKNHVDSPEPPNNERGYFGTVPLSPMFEDRLVQRPITPQQSQYDHSAPKVAFARDTVISGVSGFSGVTDDSGRTRGSDPGAPMLPGNLESGFDDDVSEKPRKKVVRCGIKLSNFFVLLLLGLFLIGVGVTVGVGVGMGMSKSGNSSPFSERPQETGSSTEPASAPTATTDTT